MPERLGAERDRWCTGGVDDLDAMKSEAVSRLKDALISREGVADALRAGFYRNPTFCFLLLIGAVQQRFGSDLREVERFTGRIAQDRADDPLGFPTEEAQLILRLSLGELELARELDIAAVNYPEIAITVLARLFTEWAPEPDEVELLFSQTEEVVRRTRELSPALAQADGLWYESGMHNSPFSGPLGESPAADGTATDDRAALARFDRQIEADPGSAPLITRRGDLLHAMGRHAEALADYDRALALDPDDHDALAGRASTYLDLDRYAEAAADFTAAMSRAADQAWTVLDLLGRALAYRLAERYAEALADYGEAIRLDPDSPSASCGRADTFRHMGRLDEALADYARAIELDPADPWTLTNRGRTYQAMGSQAMALADFGRALDLDPTAYLAITGRADSYRLTERYSEALAEYDRAIELHPDAAEAYAGRGLTYQETGRPDRARTDIRQAITLDPALGATLGTDPEDPPPAAGGGPG